MTGVPGTPAYGRVLLKLSGEALIGQGKSYGIDQDVLAGVAAELREVIATGVQLAIVIGGGNIFRGVAPAAQGMDRATADYMGMLATVINAFALEQGLKRVGVLARVQSAIPIDQMVEPYNRERAIRHLENRFTVIFAAGTGNPFFTTDTAASLRALEVDADIMLKATKVDGVYSKDPVQFADAERYDVLSYDQVLEKRLAVMDATAIALCRERNLPVRIFNIRKSNCLLRIVMGENEGTLVQRGD